MVYTGIEFKIAEITDADIICKWFNDKYNLRFMDSYLRTTVFTPVTVIEDLKDNNREKCYIVYYDLKPIGMAGIESINDYNSNGYIYYFIGEKEYQGKGLGKEIAIGITKLALGVHGLNSILASVVDINVLAEWYDLARMIQLDALVKLIFGHIAEHIGIPQNIHLIPIALELATKYNIDELDAWAIQVMTNAIRGRAVCQDIGANYRSCCRHDNGKRRRVRGKGTQYCINKGPTDTNCDTSLCCKHVYGFVTPDLIDSIPKKMLKKIIINLND